MTDQRLCMRCERRRWEHVVFVEHDENGRPTGPFETLCTACLLADMREGTPA